MKKLILFCLLGLLCLPTSTLTAKVADSPGADFLHRSRPIVPHELRDTHRGGETRSDTLPEKNGLVDHSAATGQEGESSSASVGEFFTVKGVISTTPEDSASLTYELIERELDAYYRLMDLQQDTILLKMGDFYAGTSGKQTFLLRIPMQEGFARFNLYYREVRLLQNIWVQPGDSLVVHWNPSYGQLHLSGPAAAEVRVQRHLKDVAMAESAGRNPVMLISDVSFALNTPEEEADYNAVLSSYIPSWNRKMDWLETESQRREYAEYLFSSAAFHPVFSELDRYRDILDPELYHWLRIYWVGLLHKSAVQFVRSCRPADEDWGELLLRHGLDVSAVLDVQTAGFFPQELAESLYMENRILESLLPVSFFHLSEAIPAPLKEQVDALYLIREYKELPKADSLFAIALQNTATPWIAQHLDGLQRSNLTGRPFSAYGFTDRTGETVYPGEWKGKLVVVDFWLSGCGACLSFAKDTFLPLMKEFEDHPDILFVTVAGDNRREIWEKSLDSQRYTTGHSVNLFSGGTSHPTLRENHIRSFPAQLLLDRQGKILQTGAFPKTQDGWIQLIQSYLQQGSSDTETSKILSEYDPKSH